MHTLFSLNQGVQRLFKNNRIASNKVKIIQPQQIHYLLELQNFGHEVPVHVIPKITAKQLVKNIVCLIFFE